MILAHRVLFVDDETAILNALRRLFRSTELTCFFAASGEEALELLADQPVEIIVSDMRMPSMDGATFLSRARQIQPETVRYLMTGHADMADTIHALNAGGISRYIAKPWQDDDLLQTLREGLKLLHLAQERDALLIETQQQRAALETLNATLEQRVQERTRQLQEKTEWISRSQSAVIGVFASLMAARDQLIKGQSRRVADVCDWLTSALSLSQDDQEMIHRAALLHEIGKLMLPEDVLRRSEVALTIHDLDAYREYVVFGEQALLPIPNFEGVASLVRHHNEHPDGSGYPDRLLAEQIPLGARILKVARDFVGLQSTYLSTHALSPEAALGTLRHFAGKRYDATLVETLARLLREDPTRFEPVTKTVYQLSEVSPGDRLVKDVVSKRGILLVARNTVLNAHVLNNLKKIEQAEKMSFDLFVVPRQQAVEV